MSNIYSEEELIKTILQDENRLKATNEYLMADFDPSNFYKDMTLTLVEVFKAPIACISLIKKESQVFKATLGIELYNLNIEDSFCKYTLINKEPFIVSNLQEDERFKTNIFVCAEPYIKYYAGVPLILNGHHIGALCLMDIKTRPQMDEHNLNLIKKFADMIVAYMDVYKKLIKIA